MASRAQSGQQIRPPTLGPPPPPRVPRPERWTLGNGLRVLAVPRAGMPQVAIKLLIPAGASADPAPYPGAAALVGELLLEGTERFSAGELHARLDGLGAAVSAQAGHDLIEVEALFLSETLAEALPLLGELVTRPVFPLEELERVRAETLDGLLARLDEPGNVADDRTLLELFGSEHPYGRHSSGTPEGVAAVPREELLALHAARYRPGGSSLVVAGEFEPAELRARVEEVFGAWQGAAAALDPSPLPSTPPHAGERVVVGWEGGVQAEIRVAGIGLARRAPDWIAAAVANYILGGSTITGRLGANLREEKGWTYGVRSSFSANRQPGAWVAEAAVETEVSDAAVEEMLREIERMRHEPVDAEELGRAKDALILSLPRAFETPARIVNRFATLEAFVLPPDYWERFPERVETVSADDVLRIARDCFDPARLVRVVVR